MSWSLIILAGFTIVAALAAMNLKNLVHCALALAAAFSGFGMLFLHLNAEFIGLAQILVYVGAVAILVVFAILLTRGGMTASETTYSKERWEGWIVASLFGALLVGVFLKSPLIRSLETVEPEMTVKGLGTALMEGFALPLEALAVLLTAALIGAVLIAQYPHRDKEEPEGKEKGPEA